ncbi:MAG: hypothetical protein IPG13_07665 [Rhodocyclaceae bacterium]|nr:hypothetical protein [Rhodocyclaceae bacterium]
MAFFQPGNDTAGANAIRPAFVQKQPVERRTAGVGHPAPGLAPIDGMQHLPGDAAGEAFVAVEKEGGVGVNSPGIWLSLRQLSPPSSVTTT